MSAGAPVGALALFLAVLIAQRAHELALSARHARALAARGGVERAAGQLPWLIALHVAWPVSLAVEVLSGAARAPRAWPAWLALWVGAQALRTWSQAALGGRWTTGVWVVPGERLVTRGPYRFLRHPAYLAVAVELAAAPLMFGAWRTALGATVANAVALALRIRAEEQALGLDRAAATGSARARS